MCDCAKTLPQIGNEHLAVHHHEHCKGYATEKFPYLLYYEEAVGAWVFAPEKVENIIEADQMDVGDENTISFRRSDLTDKEVAELPEV